MIHPLLSIREHMKAKILKYYKYTHYGRYMKKIHNSHYGESCFVIGNGPSLSSEDLEILYECNIDTFAVNRIYKIFDNTKWRPTYYVSTDHVLIRDTLKEVNELISCEKFIPLQNRFYLGINVKGAHYFFRNDKSELDKDPNFSLNCTEQVNMRGTVTIACIQLAIHMGYRNIYLLGVDHNFNKIISEKGQIIIDNSVKNYFCDNYSDDIASEVVHDLGNTTRAYMDIRNFADSNNIKIINTTRKTKLEAFEKMSFEEAIKQIGKNRFK